MVRTKYIATPAALLRALQRAKYLDGVREPLPRGSEPPEPWGADEPEVAESEVRPKHDAATDDAVETPDADARPRETRRSSRPPPRGPRRGTSTSGRGRHEDALTFAPREELAWEPC